MTWLAGVRSARAPAWRLIRAAATVPIYGSWDFYFGNGIVGGMITSGLEQGRVEEAEAVFRADLGLGGGLSRATVHPENVWSLKGLHDCLVRRGETVSSPWRFEEFELLPGAKDLVRAARDAGMAVVVVTNQPDISRGNLEEEELRRMHALIEQELQPDAIEVCTSGDNSDPRRKPNPGMASRFARRASLRRTS